MLPSDTSVAGTLGIGRIPPGFRIEVELAVVIPGMARAAVEAIVHEAHQVCPYANATRGNAEVTR